MKARAEGDCDSASREMIGSIQFTCWWSCVFRVVRPPGSRAIWIFAADFLHSEPLGGWREKLLNRHSPRRHDFQLCSESHSVWKNSPAGLSTRS
jgi:hypothetical protein